VRSLVALVSGCLVAHLVIHGIPPGSAGGPPKAGDIGVNISLAFMASLLGSLFSIRLARRSARLHAGAVGLLLGIGAATGFSKAASNWPSWFGMAMATACLAGALASVLWHKMPRGPHTSKTTG
jgi:hypothetical protein